MATQTLNCKRGKHVWRRESQRGKPPANCGNPNCAENVSLVESEVTELTEAFDSLGPVISGKALADRLMFNLESRGQALHQQTGKSYAGPRY